MNLETERYRDQVAVWPKQGRVILAQFDDETIVVYQAYPPRIAEFALRHGYFGGDFRLTRMSWIKPNFLWMMYRCGWATKPDQERVLGVRIPRVAFDDLLARSVYSSFQPTLYDSREAWQRDVRRSDVRLQWDPDHAPSGGPVERRAIQLGLRGSTLHRYARDWIVEIVDVTDFAHEQSRHAHPDRYDELVTPRERPYPVDDPTTIEHLGLTPIP